VFDQIIMNVRHGKLRAYHSLPNYFLLFYQEADRAGKGQKWKNALRIRVYRDCTIEAFDYETQDTHTYT